MAQPLILASGSQTRAALLRNAVVPFSVQMPRIDEEMLRAALDADGTRPRDIADRLAEAKAARVAGKNPQARVLGCDQVLELDGEVLSKPTDQSDAAAQLRRLSARRHDLHSAVVLFDHGVPVWRHVGRVRMTMRALSNGYIDRYVERNWDSIRHCVGCYRLEGEGARLFSRIEGDFFTVLGLPLLPLLDQLALMGVIET
ncbi:Maf family protein [Tropicimonas sp.]|uniref:Maf family protein n=1 Tax=Tropicimonas sp. TaxID=2067044 RepID=UPI003A842441